MNRIVTVAQMRELEDRAAAHGLPGPVLLDQAGRAVAHRLHEQFDGRPAALFLIGPGNNGGDGLVAARELAQAPGTWDCRAYLWNRRRDPDPELAAAIAAGVTIVRAEADPDGTQLAEGLDQARVIVDGLLGIGTSRPISGSLADLLDRIRDRVTDQHEVVAIDVPTGVDADTGTADPHTLPADWTLTLGAAKWGLIRPPGDDFIGRLEVLDIGIPASLDDPAWPILMDRDYVAGRLPRRPRHGNKGTFGRVLVVAGSARYYGAAALAAEAAYRAGAGLVTLATPAGLIPVFALKVTEPTFLPLPEAIAGYLGPDAIPVLEAALPAYDAVLIGPGLGLEPGTVAAVRGLLPALARWGGPVVIDADGLNALAQIPEWWRGLAPRLVLTPHPGELSRLLGQSVAEIQAHREATALGAAAAWGQTVVLKGAYTVIAGPSGPELVSPWANPILASAGTGDVLAGAIAGLLAQGLAPADAAAAGVWLHGAAGEALSDRYHDAGLLASELLPEIPQVRRNLLGKRRRRP